MIRSRPRRESCCCCSSRTDAKNVLTLTPPEIPKQLFLSCSLFPLFLRVYIKYTRKHSFITRYTISSIRRNLSRVLL